MKHSDILAHVDHTLLKATASWTDIQKLCDEAVQFQTAHSLCTSFIHQKDQGNLGEESKNMYRNRICSRIGTSSAVSILSSTGAEGY